MSLVLKSNTVFNGTSLFEQYDTFTARVLADGGEIVSVGAIHAAIAYLRESGAQSKFFTLASPLFAVKKVGTSVSKIYSVISAAGDIVTESGANPVLNGDNSVSTTGSSGNKYKTQSNVSTGDLTVATTYSPNSTSASFFALAWVTDVASSSRCLDIQQRNSDNKVIADGIGATMGATLLQANAGKNTAVARTSSKNISIVLNGVKSDFPASFKVSTEAVVRVASTPSSAGYTGNFYGFAVATALTDAELIALEVYMRSNF